MDNIINPLIKEVRKSDFVLRQVVGIDNSTLMAAQTGIRGTNDLVWVGRAANWAAKLCSISEQPYQTFITQSVFNNMHQNVKYSSGDGQLMWEERSWKGKTIYRSDWSWQV